MWQEALQFWTELAENCVTTVAIVLGGWWAYCRFVRQREKYPRATVEHSIACERLSGNAILVRVGVKVSNISSVLLKGETGTLRIQRVSPCSSHLLAWISNKLQSSSAGENEAPWPVIAEKPLQLHQQEIEPGEADTTYLDFILEEPLATVLVYSYIANAKKDNIGWNHTTMHEIRDGQEGPQMGDKDTTEKQAPQKPPPVIPPPQPAPDPVPSPRPQGPRKEPPPQPPPSSAETARLPVPPSGNGYWKFTDGAVTRSRASRSACWTTWTSGSAGTGTTHAKSGAVPAYRIWMCASTWPSSR